MTKKIISVALMALGISLSCITNLLTGDNEVISWYNANKSIIVVIAIILTLASLIIAYFAESESGEDGSKAKIKLSFFTNLITNFFSSLVAGAAITLMIIYGLGYFNFDLNTIRTISIVFVGLIVGSEFRYVGGNVGTGAIAGAFLALAFTYYFPETIHFPFLPEWFNQYPVIPNAFFAAIIGMYTGIYSKTYLTGQKIKEEEKKKNEIQNSQKFYTLRERLEKEGCYLFANNFIDDMKRQKLDVISGLQKIDESISEDMLAKEKDESDIGFWKFMMKMFSNMYRNETKTKSFKSPYYIYDAKGKTKFFSDDMDEVIEFANLMLETNRSV